MQETRRRQLLVILYFGFVSLGLPDTVLGVAWPQMRLTFDAPLETAGLLISLTTIISFFASLSTGWVMKRWNAGMVLTVCAFTTAAAMLGYGLAPGIIFVTVSTALFGIGQGAVDTAVNAFVARHYSSRQMNWIHGCWGLGATSGPLIFTGVFALGAAWRAGYLAIFCIQFCLGLFFLSRLKLWPNEKSGGEEASSNAAAENFEARNRLAPAAGVAFYFFYPGLEVVTGLWGASYLISVLNCEPATAGAAIAMYWGSLTVGRFLIGIISNKLSSRAIIRGGLGAVLIGIALIFSAATPFAFFAALAFIGLGLAPLYPTMMHETPKRVGHKRLELVTGFQVGAALAGMVIIPALVGFLAVRLSLSLAILPWTLLIFALLIIAAHEVSVWPGKRW